MRQIVGVLLIGLFSLAVLGTTNVTAEANPNGGEIRIQLHSLTGEEVADYSTYTNSRTLSFRALGRDGRPLANGVYLAVMTTRDSQGRINDRQVKKIVVMRGQAVLENANPGTTSTDLGESHASSDGHVSAQMVGSKREEWPYTYYSWKFVNWEVHRIANDYNAAFSFAHTIVWQMIREKAAFTANVNCAAPAERYGVFIPCDGVLAGIAKHFHANRLQALARQTLERGHFTMYYQHPLDNRAVWIARGADVGRQILEILKQAIAGTYVR